MINTRPLTKSESSHLTFLNNAGIECGLIFLTATGLKKSILDATQPVRELLSNANIHDYLAQEQGEAYKVILPCCIYDKGAAIHSNISLYRPQTKKGDPRLWPYKLSQFVGAKNVLAIFIVDDEICLVNLSSEHAVVLDQPTDLSLLIENTTRDYNKIANELLFKLRELSIGGPIKSVCEGATAIGRTIETALGIDINSSPLPDYKGIEIKSSRSNSNVRNTLFAQVADWRLSQFKSSREIVEAIGYNIPEKNCRKLYCTVSTKKPNSQGLFFDLDLDRGRLNELLKKANSNMPICVWRLNNLHEKLLEKHRETFWIKAKEIKIHGKDHFELETVKHTRKPSTKQFDRLLGSGEITMDHLIKKAGTKVTEKGPLFKIKPASIDELFLGRPQEYTLDI